MTSNGATLGGFQPYKTWHSDLKDLTSLHRNQIVAMWNDVGLARSGQCRGDVTASNDIIEIWPADFSSCPILPSLATTIKIIFAGNVHKRTGSSGLCGLCYKLNAILLAPIFLEAMSQLQEPNFDINDVPLYIHTGLWTPIAKRAGACTIDAIRDIEVPNEDTKILERMHNALLDPCIAPHILPFNQAFISGGDIMHNVMGLKMEFHVGALARQLSMMLLLDCTKGFNYAAHS